MTVHAWQGAGLENASHLIDGIAAWIKAGGPIELI